MAMIKKVSRQIQQGDTPRKARKTKDSVDSFTTEQKERMLRESILNEHAMRSLVEKAKFYNEKFGTTIRYSTYRKFFIEQGFSYRNLTYRPLATERDQNKWQVFKSAIHLLENFEFCDDIIAIDESGLNEKCF